LEIKESFFGVLNIYFMNFFIMHFNKITLALVTLGLSVSSLAASTTAELEARIQALEARLDEATKQVQTNNHTALRVDALEESQEKLGTKGLKISGYIDPSYIWSERQDRAGFQFLNQQWAGNVMAPDASGNAAPALVEYAFDNGNFGTVQLDFQKEIEGGSKFRLTLMPDRGGLGNSISGASIVHEASVYVPIVGTSLYAFGGQIPD
jgi:Protein of unknown function (DUF3138)